MFFCVKDNELQYRCKKKYKSTEKNVETARRKDINKTVPKTKIKHKYNHQRLIVPNLVLETPAIY
jgi:hypothetical protein